MSTEQEMLAIEGGHIEIRPALDFDTLRQSNARRCREVWHDEQKWSPTDWACALVGEVGELCNEVKKLRRFEDGIERNAKDAGQTREQIVAKCAKEMGDIQAYLDLLALRLGIDLGEATRSKFNEVSKRVGSKIWL